MTNILELLKHEKVEWKKLKNILISINTGLNPRKNFVLNDKSEVLTSWYITTKDYSQNEKIEFLENKTAKISEEARKKINQRSRLEKGDLLFSAVGTVGKIALVDIEPSNFDVNESTFILKPNYSIVNNRYLMYYLRGSVFQDKLHSKLRGSTLSGIRKGDLECMEIPIPSLEIQEKIVEILDKFTSYVTELQSELQSRAKQCTYYRDMLLSEDYLNKITKEMEQDRKVRIEKLEDICELKRGKRLVKSELQEEGEFPVYQNSLIPLGYYHESNFDSDKTFIISAGSAGEIIYSDRAFWAADDVYVLTTKEKISSKFLYYSLLSKQHVIKSKVRKASVPRLSKEDVEKISIPLPSISLQNKIVKILDKFQVMLADTKGLLPEEIAQRQKQYEYYREKLLTFDKYCDSTHARTLILSNHYYEILHEVARFIQIDIDDKVEKKMLKDIGEFINGTGMPKTTFDEKGEVGAIHYGHIYTNYNLFVISPIVKVNKEISERLKKVNYGDIVIAKTSENIEDILKSVAYLGKEEAVVGGHAAVYKHKQNPKYLSYVFNGSIELIKQKNRLARGVKVIEISSTEMGKIVISLPPLHVQQHIVSILDKFDTLVNDIKEGLPKEIEQRQKQYEYWREKLLSFN